MSKTLDIPTDDGATFDYDGVTYRVRIEPDECMSIMDEQGEGMWCGRLEWGETDRHTGRERRPRDFDGGAEKLHYGRSYDSIWWQVPADLRGEENREARDTTRSAIVDILEYGYCSIGLERLETCDFGHTHVVEAAWLGGVAPFWEDDYVMDILREHLAELAAQ